MYSAKTLEKYSDGLKWPDNQGFLLIDFFFANAHLYGIDAIAFG